MNIDEATSLLQIIGDGMDLSNATDPEDFMGIADKLKINTQILADLINFIERNTDLRSAFK